MQYLLSPGALERQPIGVGWVLVHCLAERAGPEKKKNEWRWIHQTAIKEAIEAWRVPQAAVYRPGGTKAADQQVQQAGAACGGPLVAVCNGGFQKQGSLACRFG